MFRIEDDLHDEPQGDFPTLKEVTAELERRAALPWDKAPNVAPCANWQNCGRRYEIVEYDVSTNPWRELSRIPALEVSAKGVHWRQVFGSGT